MKLKTVPKAVGETTLTGKNQVSLPAKCIRELGWERGDHLIVEVFGDDLLVLMRRPTNWTESFAGRLTDVFGTPSIVSEVLSGKRDLNLNHIKRLSERFHVPPELFI